MNTVEIEFDEEPLHLDPADPADALNLDNYVTTVTGINSSLPERLLQYVDYIGENTIRLAYDGPLNESGQYEISISNIESVSGSALFPDPTVLNFSAYGRENESIEKIHPEANRIDLANPQMPSQAGQNQSLATLQVDDNGDLQNVSGRDLLKKKIIRIISTEKGGFFHLPDYGLAIEFGKLITPTLLRKLKIDIESQVIKEKEVISVRATVNEYIPGVVRLLLIIEDNIGTFDVTKTLDLRETNF
jgi:hypothetical protein